MSCINGTGGRVINVMKLGWISGNVRVDCSLINEFAFVVDKNIDDSGWISRVNFICFTEGAVVVDGEGCRGKVEDTGWISR